MELVHGGDWAGYRARFGQDALADHPDFFAHDSGKILLQIGAEGAAFLRAGGFEPEMVCGPNVLAMTSPCDNTHALDRLAEVLHTSHLAEQVNTLAGVLSHGQKQ